MTSKNLNFVGFPSALCRNGWADRASSWNGLQSAMDRLC